MPSATRVTTRAELFEDRKRQYAARGYVIEGEQPIPINGLCSFVVVTPELHVAGEAMPQRAKNRSEMKLPEHR